MTDLAAETSATDNEVVATDELTVLKARATQMNISFSNNIKLETLRAKINAKLNPSENEDDGDSEDDEANEPVLTAEMRLREKLVSENTRLVRCRIINVDPRKKALNGEIITVANRYVGTVRKFVPFGDATENGFHIPYFIYKMLKERTFLSITTRTDPQTKQKIQQERWIKEFNIEILPDLTEEERADLAISQAAAGSVG